MARYGDIIKKAREAESQEVRKPESKKTRMPASKKTRIPESQIEDAGGELVNLGVKVPLTWRRHWAAESKRAGVSMTEIIIEALTEKFGKPE